MLPILKEAVEILFSEGLIKVLFATTTFAMGVNMPARTVAFLKTKKRDNHGELRMLDSSEYLQMAGRAGRRGRDTKGTVIIYTDSTQELPDMGELKAVLEGRGIPLESKFKVTYKMMLHLLQSENVDVTDVMHFSFSQYYSMINIMKIQKQRTALLEQMAQMKERKFDCKCEDMSNEIGIVETLFKLNQAITTVHKIDLVPGRIITVLTGEYFNAKGVVVQCGTGKDGALWVEAVVVSRSAPVKNEKAGTQLVAKFNGTLDSDEYFEYTKLSAENVLSIINFAFKQVRVLNYSLG